MTQSGPQLITLQAVCSPGDDLEPVITRDAARRRLRASEGDWRDVWRSPCGGSFFGDFAVRNPNSVRIATGDSTPRNAQTRWARVWTVNDEGLAKLTTPCHGGVHSPSQIRLKTSQIPVNPALSTFCLQAGNENCI
jgi:hypothetical protein